jgi:hypothetical protein
LALYHRVSRGGCNLAACGLAGRGGAPSTRPAGLVLDLAGGGAVLRGDVPPRATWASALPRRHAARTRPTHFANLPPVAYALRVPGGSDSHDTAWRNLVGKGSSAPLRPRARLLDRSPGGGAHAPAGRRSPRGSRLDRSAARLPHIGRGRRARLDRVRPGLPQPSGTGQGAPVGGSCPRGVGAARHRRLRGGHGQALPGETQAAGAGEQLAHGPAGLLSARNSPRVPGMEEPLSESALDPKDDTELVYTFGR